jgi:antitoxin component of MazEF toxin-antitoxin module
MKATGHKWANHLAPGIPQAIARQIRAMEGDAVELSAGADGLKIEAAPGHPTLDELLAGVTPENLHDSTSP